MGLLHVRRKCCQSTLLIIRCFLSADFCLLRFVLQLHHKPRPTQDIIDAYLKLRGTLPESIIRRVIVPTTKEDVAALIQTFIGPDRQGPANAHQFDPTAMFNQAMAGPDAEPPLTFDTTAPQPDVMPDPTPTTTTQPNTTGPAHGKIALRI